MIVLPFIIINFLNTFRERARKKKEEEEKRMEREKEKVSLIIMMIFVSFIVTICSLGNYLACSFYFYFFIFDMII